MTEKVIKHKTFAYSIPVLDEDGNPVIQTTKHGQEREKIRRAHAYRWQTVDIPLEEDVERGEALDAFFTDEELDAIRGGTAEAEAQSAVTGAPAPATEEGEIASSPPSGVPEDLNYDDHDLLVRWIKTERPNATTVVAAAGDDPDKAIALLEAEEEASGGQPRGSVVRPLRKIAES